MKFSSLQAQVVSTAKLEIQNEGGTTEYTLCMDFNALAKAKEVLGKDFTTPDGWRNLDPVEIITLCWCALARFHKDVKLEDVRSWFGAMMVNPLFVMLAELCFPGIFDRIDKDNQQGESQPNPQEPKA